MVLIVLLILIAMPSVAAVGYMFGIVRFNYPSKQEYPVRGIDVSHHQGVIDWAEIPKDEVSFVYIKATEGGDWKDKQFQENWNGARAAGFETGAYHFFTLCRDGKTQAQNFIQSAAEEGALPPAIDLEYVGNCSARPSKEDFLRELGIFVSEWGRVSMQKPVLYVTHEFYEDYLAGTRFADYPLWIRDLWSRPSKEKFTGMVIWQYGDNGRIDGIHGPVDLNARTAP